MHRCELGWLKLSCPLTPLSLPPRPSNEPRNWSDPLRYFARRQAGKAGKGRQTPLARRLGLVWLCVRACLAVCGVCGLTLSQFASLFQTLVSNLSHPPSPFSSHRALPLFFSSIPSLSPLNLSLGFFYAHLSHDAVDHLPLCHPAGCQASGHRCRRCWPRRCLYLGQCASGSSCKLPAVFLLMN